MSTLFLFPAASFLLLLMLYSRAFSRVTGLRVRAWAASLWILTGALLTGLVYALLLLLQTIQVIPVHTLRRLAAPFLEDAGKLLLLLLLSRKLHPGSERLQLRRQDVLSGIFLGLGFGLSETAMIIAFRIQESSSSLILGSIPLHMVSAGLLGWAVGLNGGGKRRMLYLVMVWGFHVLYNQLLVLPSPLGYINFLLLFFGALLVLQLLRRPFNNQEESLES